MITMTLIQWLDILGIITFAISGALVAGRKCLDVFGVTVLGCVTALGGGTIRDVILDIQPVFWVQQTHYLTISAVASILTFALVRYRQVPRRIMPYADAVGLAVFTIIGYRKGLAATDSVSIGIFMAVMTGVVGGIIRDVISDDLPLIFRGDLYASASLLGACTYAFLSQFGIDFSIVTIVSMLVVLAIRLAAIRWKISLPLLHVSD